MTERRASSAILHAFDVATSGGGGWILVGSTWQLPCARADAASESGAPLHVRIAP